MATVPPITGYVGQWRGEGQTRGLRPRAIASTAAAVARPRNCDHRRGDDHNTVFDLDLPDLDFTTSGGRRSEVVAPGLGPLLFKGDEARNAFDGTGPPAPGHGDFSRNNEAYSTRTSGRCPAQFVRLDRGRYVGPGLRAGVLTGVSAAQKSHLTPREVHKGVRFPLDRGPKELTCQLIVIIAIWCSS